MHVGAAEGARAVVLKGSRTWRVQADEDPKDLCMSARAVKSATVMHELMRPCHNLRTLSDTKDINHDSALAQRDLVNSLR
jgi:hypothetical protein